jgi:4-hydroxy-2-oxoheptanedioate aldolase
MRALDAGAQGIIVPLVEDAAAARQAVSAARYPPTGTRSWGPIRAAHEVPGYAPAIGDRRVVVVVQIETLDAVDRLEEIIAVPGVDGIFVGPNDLALSAGLEPTLRPGPGRHRDAILGILDTGRAMNTVTGIYCGSLPAALEWQAAGFDMLGVTSDALLIRTGAGAAVEALRAAD